ncbi:hypothetical protein FQN57_002522 [Myotisia sp. PD_48]|nr:hypothetical protein FQN57_002522 [Myotisia sp. PD_48]
MLVTIDPDHVESDESSSDDEDRRKVELDGIRTAINELDRLAIHIRQASTSPLEARVEIFGARKREEISSFEMKATLAAGYLYPHASESLRRRMTKLLYWKFHDKKLRTDCRRDGLPHDEGGLQSKSKLGSNLILAPVEGGMPIRKRAVASTVLRSKVNFPSPPEFKGEEDRKPCPFCRKIFSRPDFGDIEWWIQHVNEDLSPFACLLSTCSESPTFAGRSDWTAHMRNHGSFWSCGQSIPNVEQQNIQDLQEPSNLGKFAGICPICHLAVDDSEEAGVDIHQPTADTEMQISKEPREQPPSYSRERDPKLSSAGSKKLGKSVPFDAMKQDSNLLSEAEGLCNASIEVRTADESETQNKAKTMTMMLNHIANHLQFLALLTPRLSTDKLAVGDVQTFSGSQASDSSKVTGRKSTQDEDLEFVEGDWMSEADKDGILQNLPSETESMPELAKSHGSKHQLRNEEVEATTPIYWSDYQIQKRITTTNHAIDHMQQVCTKRDRLLQAALDKTLDRRLVDEKFYAKVMPFGAPSNFFQVEGAVTHEMIQGFFHMLFSSRRCGDTDIVNYCTAQVWDNRHYQDPEQRMGPRLASRRNLFAFLLASRRPSDILLIIKEGASDLDICSAGDLKQYFPTCAEILADAGQGRFLEGYPIEKLKAASSSPLKSFAEIDEPSNKHTGPGFLGSASGTGTVAGLKQSIPFKSEALDEIPPVARKMEQLSVQEFYRIKIPDSLQGILERMLDHTLTLNELKTIFILNFERSTVNFAPLPTGSCRDLPVDFYIGLLKCQLIMNIIENSKELETAPDPSHWPTAIYGLKKAMFLLDHVCFAAPLLIDLLEVVRAVLPISPLAPKSDNATIWRIIKLFRKYGSKQYFQIFDFWGYHNNKTNDGVRLIEDLNMVEIDISTTTIIPIYADPVGKDGHILHFQGMITGFKVFRRYTQPVATVIFVNSRRESSTEEKATVQLSKPFPDDYEKFPKYQPARRSELLLVLFTKDIRNPESPKRSVVAIQIDSQTKPKPRRCACLRSKDCKILVLGKRQGLLTKRLRYCTTKHLPLQNVLNLDDLLRISIEFPTVKERLKFMANLDRANLAAAN